MQIRKKNIERKGFTLIELLAVIIILGVLMIIAVPSVTEYIQTSRRDAYIKMASQYINGAITKVNSAVLPMFDVEATYYYPAKCITLEKGGDSPFGELKEAYIVITYDGTKYDYYWTSRDATNTGILLTADHLLHESKVKASVTNINTDIGIEGKEKILLIKDCDGYDIEEIEPVETIPIDGEYVPDEETPTVPDPTPDPTPTSRPEEDYNNYLVLASSASNDSATFLNGTIARKDIEEIYTVTTNEVPSDVISSWDISYQKNGSIMAWVKDVDSDGLYELYLGQERGVIANSDSKYLFSYFTNVTKMDLSNFDTSQVTDMSYMFGVCLDLINLDLSSFDTSKVTNMSRMFYSCVSLVTVDLSSFDTSKVTNMSRMFNVCNALTNLNLTGFNTRNVTDMSYMFYGCTSLVSLDLSNFDTSNVITMSEMFRQCRSLISLDVSNFNTSKVIDMYCMFEYCNNLTSLDLSSFDTSSLEDMASMFADCSKLTNLNISNFDISNVVSSSGVFSYIYTRCNVKVKDEATKQWVLSKNSSFNVTID